MYALTDYLRFREFRNAVRSGAIDARTAKRIFRRNFSRLADICMHEGCSMERARTINAALEGEVNAALLRAGYRVKGVAFNSVEQLLKDLKIGEK